MTEPRPAPGPAAPEADLDDPALRDRAVAAAWGAAPFDLLIRGAMLADPATGTVRAADVGVTGALIASVHAPGARGDAARIVDGRGAVLGPGLIDSHMHVESSMVTPATYAAAVLPRGVTTVVWDPHELGNVAGLDGLAYALDGAAAAPLRILALAPSCVPSAPGYETAGADFDAGAIAGLLGRDGIHGLAEVMDMAGVIARAPRMRGIVQAGLAAGKLVCGHARGLTGADLQAYAAAGVQSDHELTSAADLIEKLGAGLTIELRGSHDHLLPDLAAALQALPQMPPTVTLCTDDVFPDDLLHAGGLDDVLRRLVARGLAPLRALQAATLNAALRLGRRDLGLVAPGRRADLVLFEDLEGFAARLVLRDGQPVGPAPGAGSAPGAKVAVPGRLRESCALAPLAPAAFTIPARGPFARIATIDRPRFTRWGEARAEVREGRVCPPPDATLIAVVFRHGPARPPAVGVLRGWGTWRGAFATTVSHDSHNLTVFGRDPDDMAAAANAVIAAGGGMAVARQGAPVATLPLPVGGLVSEAPLAEVAAAFAAVRAAMDTVVAWEPPYLVFKALVGATLACNAGPHQTDLGIADALAGRLLASPVLEDGLPA